MSYEQLSDNGNKSVDNAKIWQNIWSERGDQVPWQIAGPHKGLVNNITALTDHKPNRHVLVPLCGASDDLIWLADQGHTVVGVEIVRDAIKIFFDKNNLEYEVSAINIAPSGAYIYKAKDKNISIVEANFWHFKTSIAGDFDAVWDRGALLAVMNVMTGGKGDETAKEYLQLIKDVLKQDGKVLLETWLFDPMSCEKAAGPKPHLLTDESLKAVCSNNWSMKRVDTFTVEANEKFMAFSFPYKINMCFTILTPNSA